MDITPIIPQIIMVAIIIFLGVLNVVEKSQNRKREEQLLDRLQSRSLDEYAYNRNLGDQMKEQFELEKKALEAELEEKEQYERLDIYEV